MSVVKINAITVPKERFEVLCGGRVVQLDNFKRMRAFGWSGFPAMNLFSMDKGHQCEIDAVVSTGIAGAS